jgi:hypothetical protein
MLSASKDSWLQIGLAKYWLPFLFQPAVRVLVVALAIGGAVAGGLGATRADEGLNLESLAPDGSYVKTFNPLEVRFQSISGAYTIPPSHPGGRDVCAAHSCSGAP